MAYLIIICGLPGVGKTTISKILHKKIKAAYISSDVVRKKMIKKPTYKKEEKKMVYDIMLLISDILLKMGTSCVLDATFYRREERKRALEIAKRNSAKFFIFECVLNEEAVKKRMERRKRGYSDADFRVYRKIKKEWEPIKMKHHVLDMRLGNKRNVERILKILGVIK